MKLILSEKLFRAVRTSEYCFFNEAIIIRKTLKKKPFNTLKTIYSQVKIVCYLNTQYYSLNTIFQ